MSQKNKWDTIVVGGGAAGCMAAIAAARSGQTVVLLEKNEKIGKKLYITGKGRCNVTNASDIDEILKNIPCNPKFLYRALHTLTSRQLMAFFEEAGCPLKIERGNRVFPVSDRSSDILKALEIELRKAGVWVRKHSEVKDLLAQPLIAENFQQEGERYQKSDGPKAKLRDTKGRKKKVQGVRLQSGEVLLAPKVILAMGGLAYPATGSTGDGYRLAMELGHSMEEIAAGLVPLETLETDFTEAAPLLLKNVGFKLNAGERVLFADRGEVQLTRFGLSGALVLSASSFLPKRLDSSIVATIDLKPALSREQLSQRIMRDIAVRSSGTIVAALHSLLPQAMLQPLFRRSGVNPDKKAAEISKQERMALVEMLKNLYFHVAAVREMKEAIITRGGICVREVDPKTMASKIAEGLYFAGEILDVDALTGGFNLQIAFSTGYLAGIQPLSNADSKFFYGRES